MIGRSVSERPASPPSRPERADEHIRRKIEALGHKLALPTVARALGVLEGEHSSRRPGGSDEFMDIRVYAPGEEARLIDWKTSARSGRPMIVDKERRATSRVWMLMDVGREMTGSCAGGEAAWQVAANALRMFATLSLRRSDDISLVLGNAASITRVPFNGGFARFEHVLDKAMDRRWDQPRHLDALLDYARRIKDRSSLLVIATDETALRDRHIAAIRMLAQTHPLVVVDVATVNPFAARRSGRRVVDAPDGRVLPAFLASAVSEREVDTHREYLAAALERELTRCGSTMIRADSSEAMFAVFVRLVSTASPMRAMGGMAR
ncbi:DUF58 domain-containing protein [Bifidobacterium avesanii]|uniref:DUF58 domain-containing protein n=1 Tax=Bifidobacterium avesanii TaxID=1798157 RepID=A0A7K3TF20_9BIFI|nr:DUF58 domain-containing protein [Bifidobacterium avesanii]KAB8295618.1 hypothetical protein DSM100685_0228 [Bifidobacterium avesanii]NEG77622.1 DUF58 domain-containing protein [Bifidobacterium avesanii]